MKRGKRVKSSGIPIWVRKSNERRLSRRSEDQLGSVETRGTDHSPPISLPAVSQPSPQQTSTASQSEDFGRLGEGTYSNTVTPLGSDVSLVSDRDETSVPDIASNPWLIFSPRPGRSFDTVQSAPNSPRKPAQAPRLSRAGTDPSLGSPTPPAREGEALAQPSGPSLSWDGLDFASPSTRKIPIVSTPDSPLTATPSSPRHRQSEESNFVFPPPIISLFSPQRELDPETEEKSDSEDFDNLQEERRKMAEEMDNADFELTTQLELIKAGVENIPVEGLKIRGPDGVREELNAIKKDRDDFFKKVKLYSRKYGRVEEEQVPLVDNVRHGAPYWEHLLESVTNIVKQHKNAVDAELKRIKDEEKNALNQDREVEKKAKDAEKAARRKIEIDKAQRLAHQTNLQDRHVSRLIPDIRNWSAASRQEVVEAYNKLPEVIRAFKDVKTSYNEFEDAAAGKTQAEMGNVKMTEFRERMKNLSERVDAFSNAVTKENDKRGLRAASSGFKANVPFPSFRGVKGEDFFIFKTQLLDAMDRNNVPEPDRFDRLRSCLSGDSLKHVPQTLEKDFENAMKTLQDIFGKPHLILKARMDEMKKIPEYSSDYKNSSEVVESLLNLECKVKALVQLAKDHESLQYDVYGKFTLDKIVSLFPPFYQLEMGPKITDLAGQAALEAVLNYIIESRKKVSTIVHLSDKKEKSPKLTTSNSSVENKHRGPKPQGRRASDGKLFDYNQCSICQVLKNKPNPDRNLFKNHSRSNPVGCPKFQRMTIKERIEVIEEANLCTICLKGPKNHNCNADRGGKAVCQSCRESHKWICKDHIEDNKANVRDFARDQLGGEEVKMTYNAIYNNTVSHVEQEARILDKLRQKMEREGKVLHDIPDGDNLFLLAPIEGKTRTLLTFFDSGASDCIAKDGVPHNEIEGFQVSSGPTLMTVASNITVECGGQWIINMERINGTFQPFRCITLKQICGEFPMINTHKAMSELRSSKKGDIHVNNCRVPEVIGGDVDLLIGCRYNKVYPEPIHQLENGLTIFSLQLKTFNQYNACLGGAHSSFRGMFPAGTNSSHILFKSYLILNNYFKYGPPSLADFAPYSSSYSKHPKPTRELEETGEEIAKIEFFKQEFPEVAADVGERDQAPPNS